MEYITSLSNQKIKHISKLIKDKKLRNSENVIVCEGQKMLDEAISNNVVLKTVLATKEHEKTVENLDCDVIIVKDHIIESISDTKTPQGIIFVANDIVFEENDIEKMQKIIILDNLKDPGNLGTIIRTASAFDIDAVILLGECADHKNPKVIRSTMGAIFKTPIFKMDHDACFSKIKVPIYATHLDQNSSDINSVNLTSSAVIIGNEATGICEQTLAFADKKIIIPMNKNTESLNASVACSIVMWEMSK